MIQRWCIGFILATGLVAGQPIPPRNQAWVLALDSRGGVVGDLKPEEWVVQVASKNRPVIDLKRPDQQLQAPQSWVLLFEPMRGTTSRAVAFTAATDFLTQVPEGDRVFIVARGKDTLESLLPGFSLDRAAWAGAMAKVPDMLPETLTGIPAEHLGGLGFNPAPPQTAAGSAGQEALTALLARFRAGGTAWAGGTTDQKGRTANDRVNLDDSNLVSSLVKIAGREMKTLESVLELLAPVLGQKHLIVFSKCETDDLNHPSIRAAMNQSWTKQRTRGDLGGPAETATLAVRDITIQQMQVKDKAIQSGVMIYSVAGSGPNLVGNMGAIALSTGGYCFPLRSELESQFGQAIQAFGSRYLLGWAEGEPSTKATSLEITAKRKGVRVVTRTQE